MYGRGTQGRIESNRRRNSEETNLDVEELAFVALAAAVARVEEGADPLWVRQGGARR